MADNVTADPGAGGATFGTDDVGGVHYPRSKQVWGPDGTVNDVDDASGKRLPVKLAEVGSVTVPISAASLPLPTSAATEASLAAAAAGVGAVADAAATAGSTGSLSAKLRLATSQLDALATLLATKALESGGNLDVIAAACAAAATSLALLDNAIAGSELQVDVVAPLPAGTNAIGKLAANSGVDIGDVDVTSLPAITGSVTANAGTDLNTSALALESGGNLAAAAASLATLDNIVAGSEAQVDVVAPLPAGTNNIGDVDVASIAAGDNNIGNVDVVTLPATPAGTNLIGQVAAGLKTDAIYEGATALTPKFAKISAASSGENSLVALVASKKIRVHAIAIMGVGTAVSAYFKDAASGNAIFADATNPIPIDKSGAAGAGGFVLGFNPLGWFQSAAGGALILNLSAAQAVAGSLVYSEVA